MRKKIVQISPGLSGVGSIFFRDEEYILSHSPKGHQRCFAEDITPFKGALELWYINNQSIRIDFMLIFLTVISVLFPKSNLHLKLLKGLPEPPTTLKCYF
jgi:lipopolysaccharide/colanic/teichoic acid biosynthesis glycosyltransferase